MKDITLGDITVKDKGPLGCDFYLQGHRIMWLNQHSEKKLIKWLVQKPNENPEIDRVSSGRIRPLPKRKTKTDKPPPAGEKED